MDIQQKPAQQSPDHSGKRMTCQILQAFKGSIESSIQKAKDNEHNFVFNELKSFMDEFRQAVGEQNFRSLTFDDDDQMNENLRNAEQQKAQETDRQLLNKTLNLKSSMQSEMKSLVEKYQHKEPQLKKDIIAMDKSLSQGLDGIIEKLREKQGNNNNRSENIRLTISYSGIKNKLKLQQYQFTDKSRKFFKQNEKSIIKIQTLFRRKKVQLLVAENQAIQSTDDSPKYFGQEEEWETLTKGKEYDPSAVTEQRPPYKYKNGSVYTGEWKGGFRDGFGVQKWADGACYEGQWLMGKAHGKGKFTHAGGDVYEGEWINNKATGFGTYIHANGNKYEGEFLNDLQHGQGMEETNDGSRYEGQYQDGKKHGYGTFLWSDGSKYVGDWVGGKIQGQGIYSWADGRVFYGCLQDDVMEGFGVYKWPDGRKYQGYYKDDKKHGYGIYIWQDSRVYMGQWSNGKQHGLGIYLDSKFEKKYGIWEEGKRIDWFDEETVNDIVSGEIDFTDYFQLEESVKYAEKEGTFTSPECFNRDLQTLKKKFNIKDL